ncbi:response regulator [Azospirillum sp. B21]|nr:response regulator [Azospirillum sp. B21]
MVSINRLSCHIALGCAFALAYYAGAYASVRIARIPEANWTVIWLSSGVGLLCVRALGRAGLAWIGAAAVATSTVYYGIRLGLPWPLAAAAVLSTAALDVIQVWLAGMADRRLGGWDQDGSVGGGGAWEGSGGGSYGRLAAYLLQVCVVPPLVTCSLLVVKDPLLGIGSFSPGGGVGGVLMKIFIVVTGNALGLFLLGPLALLWKRRHEVLAAGPKLLVTLVLVPLPVLLSTVTIPHVAILAFAAALVAAARHGLAGSVLAVLLLTLTTVGTVATKAGPFPSDEAGLTMFGFSLVIVVLGLAFHFVGIAVDALAHQQANLERLVAARTRALELKSAELAALAGRKTAFLGWLSHEVRTPLNAVLGMIRLVRRDGPGPDQDRRLGIAETAGRHLIRLLDDVLELSRLEAGAVTLAPEPADPRALAGEVAAILQPEAAAKGLRLTVAAGPDLRSAYLVDPLRVRQLLFNLTANAIKFTESGMIMVRVDAERRPDGRTGLVLEVEDTGPGVPEPLQGNIFDAYARGEVGGGRPGGAGLGLAIVREIVERMEGTVTVGNGRQGGALFRLSFPADAASDAVGEPVPIRSTVAGPGPLPPLDILLAEDGPENRLLILEWLEPAGHRVTCVASGEEAVRAVAERSFDVILMDIRLEGMDGLDATRRIRALPGIGALTPVIALTANASRRDRDAYMAAGIDEVLTKPIDPDALSMALARHAPSCDMTGSSPPQSSPAAASVERLDPLFTGVARELEGSLDHAWAVGNREMVGRIAHRLHGSAATYGYWSVAAAAAALERDVESGAEDVQVADGVAALRETLRSISGRSISG